MKEQEINTSGEYRGRATILAIMAAMAGLMFGLDTGVVAGALPFISTDFHIGNGMQGWLVSSMMVGAALGALAASNISARWGRTGALKGAGVLFLVGTAMCAFAPGVQLIIAGRIALGLAVGIAAFAAPLYISEITLEGSRGTMIAFYQLMLTSGIFLAFVADSLLSDGGHWRIMIGWLLIPATIFMTIILLLPNSPRWLMMKGLKEEAHHSLRLLRTDKEVALTELKEIEQRTSVKSEGGWRLFLQSKNFRRSVALGLTLQVMQQLTGINALLYYAPRIFSAAHFNDQQSIWATSLVGLVNVAFTGVAIVLTDRLGRRPLLAISCLVAALSLLGVGLILGWNPGLGFILSILLFIFVAGFAVGEGPIVWTLCAEIQPMRGRDFGIGCSTVVNWVGNAVISAIFPIVMAAIGASKTFFIFAALNGVFLLIVFFFVPETKGASLETIETNLMEGKKLRDIGV